ncbi:hypothetical protein HJG60_009883 [Phyllostomus discolor]|uniref:Uncharacterized protein n=1 Tax=Phyllostomus discolor TaxID=89673 RepID=A0A834ELH8_9CHIR|nr:hypothetical protein HJG60_009883 [Phyllostomus discolor]
MQPSQPWSGWTPSSVAEGRLTVNRHGLCARQLPGMGCSPVWPPCFCFKVVSVPSRLTAESQERSISMEQWWSGLCGSDHRPVGHGREPAQAPPEVGDQSITQFCTAINICNSFKEEDSGKFIVLKLF